MKILVLGSKGQLGRCLKDQLVNTDHEVIYTSREQIDIADFQVTKSKILEFSPELIINAAGYTAVDKAEEDQKTANLINHLAVKNIADICNQQRCWLVHLSTDYVFDGNANAPYQEHDKTNPQCIYGETKLNGEFAIHASGCKHIIIRTAWVFSEYGNNFLKTMLHLGANRDEVSIVGDQIGCPTYAQDLAKAIVQMLNYLADESFVGLYHFCGDEQCSWFQFGNEIFRRATELGFSSPDILHEIITEDYPTPAIRPAYSVLDDRKVLKVFGIKPSDWRAGISRALVHLR